MEDDDRLDDHPVKLYNGWVLLLTSIVKSIGFPIKKVNRFTMVCTKIVLDDYRVADEKAKLKMNKKFKETEEELVKKKYLPEENNKEKKD